MMKKHNQPTRSFWDWLFGGDWGGGGSKG